MEYFNKEQWLAELHYPDWYIRLKPEYERILAVFQGLDKLQQRKLKHEVYSFFEQALTAKEIFLASDGPNMDKERKDIDTIVIHHTKTFPVTRDLLSAIHLLRLYTGYHSKTTRPQGEPLWSGHFYKGTQVFYSYHWLVHEDGKIERLLNDDEIGYQAGNWDVNCRSIAISINANLEERDPTPETIASIKKIIEEHYPTISKDRIIGHREVNVKTICPGNTFINGWKTQLIGD